MKTTYNKLIAFALILSGGLFEACTEAVEIGEVDQKSYSGVTSVNGYLKDAATGKSESIIELRKETYESSLFFGLTRTAGKGVDLQVEYDAAYAESYNALHATKFPLYPETSVSLGNGGKMLMAPDEKRSGEIRITVSYDKTLEDGATYLLPLKVTSQTEGISVPEKVSRCTYLVKNYHNEADTFKGYDAVKTILYFEVNDTNPLNALEFKTSDGALFFDYVILFAANINYNAETGKVFVNFNDQVQFLMDHNEEYIQPLRKRGIKVLLGLLGNHDPAGLAQLSTLGSMDFARELRTVCDTYNLDGVNFDDEWSNPPAVENPLFGSHTPEEGARLCYETKKIMPDKYVTVFDVGQMYEDITVEGVVPGDYIDIGVGLYYNAAEPLTGMTKKNCTRMSYELNRNPTGGDEQQAREEVKEAGYGYCMMFALFAANAGYEMKQTQIKSCNRICKGLYEQELQPVEYYYPFQSTVRTPITE